jgi:hypothetical protein
VLWMCTYEERRELDDRDRKKPLLGESRDCTSAGLPVTLLHTLDPQLYGDISSVHGIGQILLLTPGLGTLDRGEGWG